MEFVGQVFIFIITSFIGGFVGFFLAEFIFEPVKKAQEFRARTHSLLRFSANVALLKDPESGAVDVRQLDRYLRVTEDLRKLSTDMLAFCYVHKQVAKYFLNRWEIDFERASKHLFGYSNSLDAFDGSRGKQSTAVRRALQLPEED